MTRRYTPPQIAQAYGIKPEKVLHWIKNGELAAVNIATRATGRPRFVVSEDDLKLFEARRSATPIPKAASRKRQRDEGVVEFF